MITFTNSLNNRDIALIIWIIVILFWLLFQKNILATLFSALKIFASKKILIPFILMLSYIALMILAFSKIGFWNTPMTKDTVYWIIGAALVMFVNFDKAIKDEHYFKSALLDNLKLVVLLEFIINLYVFNLIVEVILLPIIAFIILLSTYAGTSEQYISVKKMLDVIMGIIGLSFILFALYNVTLDFQGFVAMDNLRSFALPPIFTLVFFPFIYFLALYSLYENIFIRLDHFNEDKRITNYAKWKIIAACHFNLRKLRHFSKQTAIMRITNKADVLAAIHSFKDSR